MNTIVLTIIVSFSIAFALGVLLGIFQKLFYVKTDPKIEQIMACLSGGNCGGCGYAGCSAFAKAVAEGIAPVTGCVAGGKETADKIAKVLGVTSESANRKVAFLACNGSKSCAKDKAQYNGVKTCQAAQIAINGTKLCTFGCIGFGDCQVACPFNAIKMSEEGLPCVDYKKCTGCGMCVKTCPKKLFSLIIAETKGSIAVCSNKSDNKPQIKKNCSVGCFKCGICEKKCPEKCINISSGIPQIDYTKCTSCGECVKACPDKVLHLVQELTK